MILQSKIDTIDDIIKANHIYSDDMVIAHTSETTDVLINMLELSLNMKNMGRIRDVYVLSASNIDNICEEYKWCKIIPCDRSRLESLARSFAVTQTSSQLYFDSFSVVYDADPLVFLGYNGIGQKELLAISLFDDISLLDDHSDISTKAETDRRYIDWGTETPPKYYESCKNLSDIINIIDEKVVAYGEEIVLFGVTPTMENVIRTMGDKYKIIVVDNDPVKWGKHVCGLEIRSPKCLEDKKGKVFVTSRRYKAIFEQLYAMDYKPWVDVFVLHESVMLFHCDRDEINEAEEKIDRGKEVYRKICEKHQERQIYINPHTGTGDVYMSWLYIAEDKELYGKKDYVLLIQTESCSQLADLLDMKNQQVTLSDMSDLVAFGRYHGMDRMGIMVLNYSFEQFAVSRLRGYKGIDYNTMLQKSVFGTACRAYPQKIPRTSADEVFEKYDLKKGRAVLLSPYAVHTHQITAELWNNLSRRLSEIGYDICTNIHGEEKPVDGTIGVDLEYGQVADFVDKAGLFIGVRSGLCDIIAASDCKMVILYPHHNVSKYGSFYEYFSLQKMGLRDEELFELEYYEDEPERYIDLVLSYVEN